jgi:hypothetical protein
MEDSILPQKPTINPGDAEIAGVEARVWPQ